MLTMYSSLNRIPFLAKSYSLKFLFVAFLGIHVPLIGLLFVTALSAQTFTLVQLALIVLVFTLLGTLVTLFILKKILKPVELARNALHQYVLKKELPNLPIGYKDEVGELLADLHVAVHKLYEMEHTQSDLIGLMSHDLRAPLITATGLAELIKIEQNKDAINQMSEMLIDELKRQLNFIDGIARLYKADYVNLHLEKCNLKQFVQERVKELSIMLANKSLHVDVLMEPDLEAKVDQVLFKQVVMNLLTNAIKYSYKGGKITVRAKSTPQGLQLSITDYGVGYTSETQPQLFKQIIKHGKQGTNGEDSTGLGLYLCAKIVAKHQGQILSCSDGTNKGATFTIQWPQ